MLRLQCRNMGSFSDASVNQTLYHRKMCNEYPGVDGSSAHEVNNYMGLQMGVHKNMYCTLKTSYRNYPQPIDQLNLYNKQNFIHLNVIID